ncbi:hypothetical protein [Mesorhizobium sp. B2-3-5]|uniref:ATP-dependent DNA ligase n=1 Tax=Mesorhizobium sp. B2-3-5 TaxID=2589958 RepID=UPI0032B10AC7
MDRRVLGTGGRSDCDRSAKLHPEGENIKINAAGLADFHALQSAVGTGSARDICLVAFDLLYLNGEDLRDHAVETHREILQSIIPAGNRIRRSLAAGL